MKKTLEVVALVYKSPRYAEFITDQLVCFASARGWDVTARVVANDPEVPEALLLEAPREMGLRTDVYHDCRPGDYYLNRVYRCWNWCVASSQAEHVCLVNSDMAFSPGWLDALLEVYDDGACTPTSRLVESGKLLSGRHAVSKNLGRTPDTFHQAEWLKTAEALREKRVEGGGLFMPVVFERAAFLGAGGYPEGNVYRDGVGTRSGPVVRSGDAYFFDKLEALGRPHLTSFDSLVYHFQEGEMDEPKEPK